MTAAGLVRRLVPRFYPGDALVAGLAFLPVAVVLPGSLADLPAGLAGWLRELGRLAGVVGLAWMLLAGLLAIRLPRLDAWFGGLTRLWYVHHMLGTGAFLALLIHPLLLAFAALPTGTGTATALLFPPVTNWAVWLGWGALAATVIFLAPTYRFFGEPDYERWKRLHFWSALALALAVLHALPLAAILPWPVSTGLWAVYAGLAGAAYAWRGALAPRFGRLPYRIEAVSQLAPRVVELRLQSDNANNLEYRAGQFVYMTPDDPDLDAGRGEEHPYTLSSAPGEASLRIAIKDLGDASRALQVVTPGTRAWIEGPYGRFYPDREGKEPELWIGGGIGLTPFVGRARDLAARDVKVDIHLIYCAQDAARAYFLDELTRIAGGPVPGLWITPHFFALHGPLELAYVRENVPDADRRVAYICGPLPLIDRARAIAFDLGIPRKRIQSEEFTLL